MVDERSRAGSAKRASCCRCAKRTPETVRSSPCSARRSKSQDRRSNLGRRRDRVHLPFLEDRSVGKAFPVLLDTTRGPGAIDAHPMNRAHIDLRSGRYNSLNCSGVLAPCALGIEVFGANMQCERFVALQLKVPHHFIERYARGRSRRLEPPATFGAAKSTKMLLFNPHQFPAHGRLYRTSQRCLIARTRSLSRYAAYSGTELTGASLNGLSGVLHSIEAWPPQGVYRPGRS